ncbi:MAG: Rieske (2Fe-2S) protein [Gemmatimonadota bacterium]
MSGSSQPGMDRRNFVVTTCGALGAATVGGVVSAGCASLATVPVRPVNGRVTLELRNHPRLLRPGGFIRIAPGGAAQTLFVIAAADGSYDVLSSICTHLKCTVNMEGERLVCPCHGSTYARTGEVLVGPAEKPLTRYPTSVTRGGALVIELGGAA